MLKKILNTLLKKVKSLFYFDDLAFFNKKEAKSKKIKPDQEQNLIQAKKFNLKHYYKVKISTGGLAFRKLYEVNDWKKQYLIVGIASMFIGFLYWFFFQYTGVYSAGLSSFSQGISRLVRVSMLTQNASINLAENVYNILFWTSFFVFNIPLAIFAYFKLGKRFTKLTIFGLICSDVFGLGLGFIPNSKEIVTVFGNSLSSFQPLSDKGVQILLWNFNAKIDDLVRFISLLMYSLVGSALLSIFYSIIYITGGSTGGTDFVSYYFSLKKHKPLGSLIMYFNTFSLICGVFLGSFVAASIAQISPKDNAEYLNVYKAWDIKFLVSPNLIASALASILMGVIINSLFPKNKMVKLKIYGLNVDVITQHLIFKLDYAHAFTVTNAKGAYSQKPTQIAETVCQFVELPLLIKTIHEVDAKALVTINNIEQIHGHMNVYEKIE